MTRTLLILVIGMAVLHLVGCDWRSCEERGGKLVHDGDVIVWTPIGSGAVYPFLYPQYRCEGATQ